MSIEHGRFPKVQGFEVLTPQQEERIREDVLAGARFRTNYLLFQEWNKSRTLLSLNLTRDQGGAYSIIFPYNGKNYLLPYGHLDYALEAVFEGSLISDDPRVYKGHKESVLRLLASPGAPDNLKPYQGEMVTSVNNVYRLNPQDNKGKAVMQTTFLEMGSNCPIAEVWTGIIIPKQEPQTIYQAALPNYRTLNIVIPRVTGMN